eukprot:scaffold1883_cov396-Prasinococcus_capsulatus_cf.AAC.31
MYGRPSGRCRPRCTSSTSQARILHCRGGQLATRIGESVEVVEGRRALAQRWHGFLPHAQPPGRYATSKPAGGASCPGGTRGRGQEGRRLPRSGGPACPAPAATYQAADVAAPVSPPPRSPSPAGAPATRRQLIDKYASKPSSATAARPSAAAAQDQSKPSNPSIHPSIHPSVHLPIPSRASLGQKGVGRSGSGRASPASSGVRVERGRVFVHRATPETRHSEIAPVGGR